MTFAVEAVCGRSNPFRAFAPLVGILLAATACATAGKPKVHTQPAGPEQRFSMTGSGIQTSALVTPEGAQGPQVDLGRYDGGKTIRGTANGKPLSLTVTDNAASGVWAAGPLTINITEEAPEQMKVTGVIAGRPSTFTVTPDRIEGTIGFCAYDLNRSGDVYLGSRSCAGGIGQVTVQFPSTIGTWRPINIAVLMAVLMATP
jgi:hypothetical protein